MRPEPSKILEQMLRHYCAEAGEQLQPVCVHALTGGGRTRATLLLRASERDDRVAFQAACALEMMHAATLLQDDIFDRSAQRRGRRAAYLAFGEAQAVLASDWLLLRSLEVAAEVDMIFFQQLACAARTMAAAVAKELNPPALRSFSAASAYIAEICKGKTATLFAVSLHAAALLHTKAGMVRAQDWAAVGSRMGCTYQLLDDCLDVYAPADVLDKSSGIDLQQGRLTLPIALALEALQAAGEHVSLDRFREASLTAKELEMLSCAAGDPSVRAHLDDELRVQIRDIESAAWLATVPSTAIASALVDMRAKVSLCFGNCEREAVMVAGGLQQAHAV